MAAIYAVYLLLERKRKRNAISRKILKDLQNPFDLEEDVFKKKFSLDQRGVHYLCKILTPIMKRNQGYPLELQILSSLQVLRSGSFQIRVGEDQILGVSQATVSRSLDAFLDAILEMEPSIIEFPNPAELAFNGRKFYGQSKIPNIIGVVDCIHVMIQKPHNVDSKMYRNRNQAFSINVQLVCDSDLYILDAVVYWPGSAKNNMIWRQSTLRNALQDYTMPNKMFLIGNNSFPLEPWLLVPYEDCHRSEQLIFNDHLERALNTILNCEAALRSRFKCLHHNSGPLYYSPEKCCKIITACFALHNICVKLGIDLCDPIDLDKDIYFLPSSDFEDDEETMIKNEAMCIRDDIARQLLLT